MTAAQFDAMTAASIAARIAAEPVLARCVCGAEDEPDLTSEYGRVYTVYCDGCDRSVSAATKAITIEMWNRCMGADK